MHDQLQTLENDALRGKLGLDKKATGMVVHKPDRDDADYPLKEWDLITKIGDHEIDNIGHGQGQRTTSGCGSSTSSRSSPRTARCR